MRASIVLAVFCFLPTIMCISEEMMELARMLRNTCVTETGVDPAVIEDAAKGNLVEDPKLKCYMRCTMIQTATMGDDGLIDVEATIAMLPDEIKDKAAPVMRKCGTKIGTDHCDNAFQTYKCYYEADPANFFIV